jgi:hypothetical protein
MSIRTWFSRQNVEESVQRGDDPQVTQHIIDEEAEFSRQSLLAKAQKLYDLREQFDIWQDVFDSSDAFIFGDDGQVRYGSGMVIYNRATAYANALNRPGFSACAYINLWQLNMIRAHSRAFCLLNPYWWTIQQNLANYVVDTGHTYTVMPRDPKGKVSDEALQNVQEVIDEIREANDWRNYQAEKLRRGDRDGEFLLRKFHEENEKGYRVLRLRFQEPRLLWDPPTRGPKDDVWFGIQFRGGNYQDAQGYFLRPADYLGTTDAAGNARWDTVIDKAEIQHRKFNVDLNDPRGLPTPYAIAPRLDQAQRTVIAMGKLVHYREKIALIRKHINATLSTVQAYLGNRMKATKGGVTFKTVDDLPDAAIIDTNDQTQYEFPSQHIDTDKIVCAVKAELQCAAGAVGLADFIWADSSGSSFAARMVSEGPMDKTIRGRQAAMVRDDLDMLRDGIKLAIEDGRLPGDTLEKLKVVANTPQIIARNRLSETQADQLLVQSGAMSPQTMCRRAGLEPDRETELQKDHQKEFPPPEAGEGGAGLSGRTVAGRQKVTARPFKSEPATAAHPQQAKRIGRRALRPTE